MTAEPGRIVILNGAPRAGKSSIVAAMQRRLDGVWMNLGVDVHAGSVTPPRYRPGIGLRPGGDRPDLEPLVPALYAALYASIAAHARLGLDVVADVGHHDAPARKHATLRGCARLLAGLPALLVGVRCPLDAILARRRQLLPGRAGLYLAAGADGSAPGPVLAWQREVHEPGVYDIEVDTSALDPEACAEAIARRLGEGLPRPSALERIAAGEGG